MVYKLSRFGHNSCDAETNVYKIWHRFARFALEPTRDLDLVLVAFLARLRFWGGDLDRDLDLDLDLDFDRDFLRFLALVFFFRGFDLDLDLDFDLDEDRDLDLDLDLERDLERDRRDPKILNSFFNIKSNTSTASIGIL